MFGLVASANVSRLAVVGVRPSSAEPGFLSAAGFSPLVPGLFDVSGLEVDALILDPICRSDYLGVTR